MVLSAVPGEGSLKSPIMPVTLPAKSLTSKLGSATRGLIQPQSFLRRPRQEPRAGRLRPVLVRRRFPVAMPLLEATATHPAVLVAAAAVAAARVGRMATATTEPTVRMQRSRLLEMAGQAARPMQVWAVPAVPLRLAMVSPAATAATVRNLMPLTAAAERGLGARAIPVLVREVTEAMPGATEAAAAELGAAAALE